MERAEFRVRALIRSSASAPERLLIGKRTEIARFVRPSSGGGGGIRCVSQRETDFSAIREIAPAIRA